MVAPWTIGSNLSARQCKLKRQTPLRRSRFTNVRWLQALTTSQNLLDDVEAAQIIEAIYGALVAYSQTIMLRMKAEDPEIGGVDHAFRAGQAYGVSCVLNHLIDKLTDITGGTELGAMDAFSDTLHDEIIIQGRAAGLTVELLDAQGDILLE